MRLHILSDLHLEKAAYQVPEELRFDVAVAAGDIGEALLGIEFLKKLDRPVIYVLGNHEYYSPDGADDMAERLAEIRCNAQGTNVTVLENEAAVIGGVRFLGTTLWTNFANADGRLLHYAQNTQHDYRHIGIRQEQWPAENTWRQIADGILPWEAQEIRDIAEQGRFHPLIALDMHTRALHWLDDQLRMIWHGPTVVVTHHHPSFESLKRSGTDAEWLSHPARWDENDPSQPLYRVASYASDLDSFLFRHKGAISLWVAGHLHTALDYVHHGVRVVCNPRGIVKQSAPKSQGIETATQCFDPSLVIHLTS